MKKKQAKSLATGIIAIILILAGYFLQANEILPQTEPVQSSQIDETVAQEIQLQDNSLHVISWDVGQADCIFIQSQRKKHAD